MNFYVYLHRRASDMEVFYVGKGSGKRAWIKANRPTYWKNVVKKHGLVVEIFKSGMSELCAYVLESILIAKYKSIGGFITNRAIGGDKYSGWAHSIETVEIIRAAREKEMVEVYTSLGEKFRSIAEAAASMAKSGYPSAGPSGIHYALKKSGGTAYGRSWSRVSFPPHPEFAGRDAFGKHTRRKVRSSSGLKFNSVREAADHMKSVGFVTALPQSISNCANGRQKTAYGLSWEYDIEGGAE